MKVPRALCDRGAQTAGKLGILKHQRALKIAIAVKSLGQPEMPFEQRARLAEQIEYVSLVHGQLIARTGAPACRAAKGMSKTGRRQDKSIVNSL